MLDQLIIALTCELSIRGATEVLKLMKIKISASSITDLLNSITLKEHEDKIEISDIKSFRIISYLDVKTGKKFLSWFYGKEKVEIVTKVNAVTYAKDLLLELKAIKFLNNKYDLMLIFLNVLKRIVENVPRTYKILFEGKLFVGKNQTQEDGEPKNLPVYDFRNGFHIEVSSKHKDSIVHDIDKEEDDKH